MAVDPLEIDYCQNHNWSDVPILLYFWHIEEDIVAKGPLG